MPTTQPTSLKPAKARSGILKGPHLATSKIQFRKILLAIDFSAQTHEVIKAGIQIATEFHSELFLLHSTEPVIYGTGAEPIALNTYDLNLEIAQGRMADLKKEERALASYPYEEIVSYAAPVDLIQQIVKEKKIDLVIASSHGAKGIERVALGSVAECILRTVSCPVLVIGPRSIITKNLFSSILLATDLTPADMRSAQYATGLAERFRSELTLLHVVEPVPRFEVQPEVGWVREQLQELIPSDFASHATAKILVEHGRGGNVIASAASVEQSTLIVTGARKGGALANHSLHSKLADVIRRSTCPVLCVRGHAA